MIFLHAAMLTGLVALAVPILIHLLHRRRATTLDWGAMRFLLASLTTQSRRIMLEEMLLLVLRCLLVVLIVVAMARPFLPSGSSVPWIIVVPAALGSTICLAVATAAWPRRRARWMLLGAAALLAAITVGASTFERWAQERKWAAARGEKDVAIVIDASASMTGGAEGRPNFEKAIDEARTAVDACLPGDAVSIILAGPVPRPVLPAPTADRRLIAAALDEARPIGGTMNVLEGLSAAAASLADGQNPAKKIVLITDGQSAGWDVRSDVRWRLLAERLKEMPTPPRIILRRLGLQQSFRNACVADMGFSRDIVGTDRPVSINVRVENTGTMPIRPAALELTVDGQQAGRESFVADIPANAAETLRFEHQFAQPGIHLVSAVLKVSDDMPSDDTAARVLAVIDKLSVLIVEGAPSALPLGGAASFMEIALAPREEDEAGAPGTARDAGEDMLAHMEDVRFLVEPRVAPAAGLAQLENLGDFAAIVLANVSRLPESVAAGLVDFVRNGGGLLIVNGERSLPEFYNNWTTKSAQLVAPARLAERRSVPDNPCHLEPKSFTHPALRLLVDSIQSDAASALVQSYWKLDADARDPDVRVGGRLSTGEPFLVERSLGKGHVLMTATSLDHKGSNLPALKCFVPMVHELTYYLAASAVTEANVRPGAQALIELPCRPTGLFGIGGVTGLLAEYCNGMNFEDRKLTRIDPTVDFAWDHGSPHPYVNSEGFSARWTGWLRPRYSESYTFHALTDDGVRLWVDDRPVVDYWAQQNPTERTGTAQLVAGRWYRVRMEFFEGTGYAGARLFWSSRSQQKEIIPTECLYPAAQPLGEGKVASQKKVKGPRQESVEVITPSQRRARAALTFTEDAVRVDFADTQEPGLYSVMLPEGMTRIYAGGVGEGQGLPLVVLGDSRESRLMPLNEADLGIVARHVDLFRTETPDELVSAIAGGVPGEELWKYLAIGALLMLLGEIALSRWITLRRRLHAVEEVRFGGEAADVRTFRERATELLAGRRAAPGETSEP